MNFICVIHLMCWNSLIVLIHRADAEAADAAPCSGAQKTRAKSAPFIVPVYAFSSKAN